MVSICFIHSQVEMHAELEEYQVVERLTPKPSIFCQFQHYCWKFVLCNKANSVFPEM